MGAGEVVILGGRRGGDTWAGLHDNVPDRPSAMVAPAGCQLATTALKIKTVTYPKMGVCTAEVVTQSGTSVHLG